MNKKNYLWSLQTLMMVVMLSISFVSCSSDDDTDDRITTTSVTLFANRTKTIEGNVREMVSDNKFVATVENNVIKGNHVGEAIVTVNGKYKISVSVVPLYNIIDDPITEWGISKANVKAKHTQGTLYKENEDALLYQNCGDASFVLYSFEDGKLKGVVVQAPLSKLSSFTDYLMERFTFYPGQFSDYTFLGIDSYSVDDAKTVVALTIRDISNVSAVYMPRNKFNSDSSVETRNLFRLDE